MRERQARVEPCPPPPPPASLCDLGQATRPLWVCFPSIEALCWKPCRSSRALAPAPPKRPQHGAARPSCLLEAPLAAGRRQPWPPLLPASFLSHFSASGQALRAPEAKT